MLGSPSTFLTERIADKVRLGVRVGLAITREAASEIALQSDVFRGKVRARSEAVPKRELIGAETINMVGAMRADAGQLTPELGRTLFEVSYVLGYNGAGVGIGIFVLAIATVALRSRTLLPRWLWLLLFVLGAAFITPLSRFLIGPSILLLAVVSAGVLRPSKSV
jgi:hypothetical protein